MLGKFERESGRVIGERATVPEEIPGRMRGGRDPRVGRNSPPVSCHPLWNSRATHRACFPTSRGIETFPTGYTELTRRSQIPGAQEEEGKKMDRDAGNGGFMLNGLDSGMRFLDELPSPTSPAPLRPRSSSRNEIGGRSKGERVSLAPDRIGVALIASSKSGLIDEFRGRVARK